MPICDKSTLGGASFVAIRKRANEVDFRAAINAFVMEVGRRLFGTINEFPLSIRQNATTIIEKITFGILIEFTNYS